jgi:hypothetical protein
MSGVASAGATDPPSGVEGVPLAVRTPRRMDGGVAPSPQPSGRQALAAPAIFPEASTMRLGLDSASGKRRPPAIASRSATGSFAKGSSLSEPQIGRIRAGRSLPTSAHPEQIRKEVEAAVRRGASHVVIDEVQRIPAILDEVHGVLESGLVVSFVMSGSSTRKLKRSKANLLAGRAFSHHLHPLTAAEIGSNFDLNQALTFGCLPPIVAESNQELRREILRSYVETYIVSARKFALAARQVENLVRHGKF